MGPGRAGEWVSLKPRNRAFLLSWARARAYRIGMPKRSSKDENETTFAVVAQATGQTEDEAVSSAAAALGRRGGLKGGPARAAVLSPAKRRAIAKKAAKSRWSRG